MRIQLSLIAVVFVFAGCNNPNEKQKTVNRFNLTSFMNSQTDYLNKIGAEALRVSVINGSREENRFVNIDWKRELQIFNSADINNQAMPGDYVFDSLPSNDSSGNYIIKYTAANEKLKTRVLEIIFNKQNEILKIKADLYSENIVARLSEQLEYIPFSYYKITTREESRWLGTDFIIIAAEIDTSK